MKNLKIVPVILAGIVIIGGMLYWLKNVSPKKQPKEKIDFSQQSQVAEAPTLEVKRTEVKETELPEDFPGGVPMEKGAKIIQNFNATTNDGRFQATREFETVKTLDENYKLYKKFLADSGWKIIVDADQNSLKTLTGTKGEAMLQISMSTNSLTKVNSVNISYTVKQ